MVNLADDDHEFVVDVAGQADIFEELTLSPIELVDDLADFFAERRVEVLELVLNALDDSEADVTNLEDEVF